MRGYESHYLRAVHPDEPRGVWIRHTTLNGARSLWCTVWDGGGTPRTAKVTPPRDRAGVFGPGRAAGAIPGDVAWDVRWEAEAAPLRHLPHPALYHAPLPRTKLESPAPAAVFSGTVGGLRLDGWRGMAGHNWGARHAERWVWLHGIGFGDAPGAWVDLALGRVKVAGATTPWTAAGALELDGVRHRLGPRARVDAVPGAATVVAGDVRIRVTAPPGATAAWVYADPPGGEHHVLNCSIARIELTHRGRTLASAHGGAYELGVRERDHGVPLAPFPDP